MRRFAADGKQYHRSIINATDSQLGSEEMTSSKVVVDQISKLLYKDVKFRFASIISFSIWKMRNEIFASSQPVLRPMV